MSAVIRIAIIGAGFSGFATTINLLRSAKNQYIAITLINPEENFGAGLAYGDNAHGFLLNVPTARMSLYQDKPDDFLDYCQEYDPSITSKCFVKRSIFSLYIKQRYRAIIEKWNNATINEIKDLAVSVRQDNVNKNWKITTQQGFCESFEHVILATGYSQSSWPIDIRRIPTELAIDTWDFKKLENLPAGEPLLIIGTGLTAMDTVLYIHRRDPKRRIILLSRRGLLPNAHQDRLSSPGSSDLTDFLAQKQISLAQWMRSLRKTIHDHQAKGLDWRDVLDDLRPHVPSLWQQLSGQQKQLFQKYIMTYWDVHRHRMPTAIAEKIRALKEDGLLTICAGSLQSVDADRSNVLAVYRVRGSQELKTIKAAAVMNCSGHSTNPTKSSDPLFKQMLTSGLISPNADNFGIAVNADYETINRMGVANPGLWYVGPMLKAYYWESTAVPELRLHAQTLAQNILSRKSELNSGPSL